MENDNTRPETPRRPLVLHIEEKRQWYRDQPISRKTLSELSGVPVTRLARYERLRGELPRSVADMLRLALALDVRVEDLIAPKLLSAFNRVIEEARRETDDPSTPSTW